MLHALLTLLVLAPAYARAGAAPPNVSTWHVLWVGGQSNSVATNTATTGFPDYPADPRIQMFCWRPMRGCVPGTFAPAVRPLYNEANVGWSLTFANLLLATLPATDGVVLVNTGVGGTGFYTGAWAPPAGPLVVQSVAAVTALAAALPVNLTGAYRLHAMLWHQGEADGGDNRAHPTPFRADFCTYLVDDLSALVTYLRATLPGATPATPFVNGGLLPYWVDSVPGGVGGVERAIYALNTSRACTGTADSRVFADFLPDGTTPNGDPEARSGASGLVIHFSAQMSGFFGFEYWRAYLRALALTAPVPDAETAACANSTVQPAVAACG